MQKKVLIALDHSDPSRRALQYVIDMADAVPELHFVLYHVQPMISLFLQDEAKKSAAARKRLDGVFEKNNQAARRLLLDFSSEMTTRGIAADRIETRTQMRQHGYAKDIIEAAQHGRYDAIVVGRRRQSGLEKLYSGSVTADILEQAQVVPVWLVDGRPTGDILLAVDGSTASMRAVDHVGFMLSGNATTRIILLHVVGSARNFCEVDLDASTGDELEAMVQRADQACIDRFYPQAVKKFESAGLQRGQIETMSVKGGRQVGKAIMEVAAKGTFGTIVVGRRGMDKSFFMGSVSRYVTNKLTDAALWLVP